MRVVIFVLIAATTAAAPASARQEPEASFGAAGPASARAVAGAGFGAPKRAEDGREGGQAPAPAPQAPATPPAQTPAREGPPTPPPNYTYEPDGRRDPFISLVNRGSDSGTGNARVRPEGIAGILVEEVVVRGIVQSRGGYVAMIASPSGRTYSIRPGDRLLDGSVRAITPQAVVLMQEVNDPLSLEKQREVRKFLRAEVK